MLIIYSYSDYTVVHINHRKFDTWVQASLLARVQFAYSHLGVSESDPQWLAKMGYKWTFEFGNTITTA